MKLLKLLYLLLSPLSADMSANNDTHLKELQCISIVGCRAPRRKKWKSSSTKSPITPTTFALTQRNILLHPSFGVIKLGVIIYTYFYNGISCLFHLAFHSLWVQIKSIRI